jgi:hypothetical protein
MGIYAISLDDNRRPILSETSTLPAGSPYPPGFPAMTPYLSWLNRTTATFKPDIDAIGTDKRGYRHTLEIVPRAVDRCAAHLTSRFVERSPQGRETRAYVIFRGNVSRECGE